LVLLAGSVTGRSLVLLRAWVEGRLMVGWVGRRWRLVVCGVIVVAVVVGLVVWLVPGGRSVPSLRRRASIAFSVCVLTDSHGTSAGLGASVWRGVLKAQATTNLRAQGLRVGGSGGVPTAVVGVDTLAMRGCRLVVAVGAAQVAAVWKQAAVFRDVWFVVVNGVTGHARNVAILAAHQGSEITDRVAEIAISAVKHRFQSGEVS
jgi:basic membrane lipoprotein Med (substrate-binding protein (PBP1-ABC) superfamily)